MEQLITFLESAWGYCLIGGITVGSLVTMLILLIKFIKLFKTNEGSFLETINKAVKHKDESDISQATNTAQSEYFSEVQAILFKLLSYIVMASKMAQDDKIALLNSVNSINKDRYIELFTKAYTDLKENIENIEMPEVQLPAVVKEVTDVVEVTKTLLDKYVN